MCNSIKKKVAIIGTNGLPGHYGGWDQLVNHLTIQLRQCFNFVVYTSFYNSKHGVSKINGAEIVLIKLKANGFQSILYDIVSIIHAIRRCDVLYICGVSGCLFLPYTKRFNKKIILNPDGLEWKRNKFSFLEKLFLKISERVGIKYSDVVIADNEKISEYIKKTYNVNSSLIEYGGDHVIYNSPLRPATQKIYNISPKKYAFIVCRIEPENNIDLILDAFRGSQIILVVVGNWTFSRYGKTLRKQYENYGNIRLLDPIYNQNKLDELRNNCLVYMHGHSVGGTNPSLVEAMNLGLFIISYDTGFNRVTTENKALYFNSSKQLGKLLIAINENKIDVAKYSNQMKIIAARRYVWKKITEQYRIIFDNPK